MASKKKPARKKLALKDLPTKAAPRGGKSGSVILCDNTGEEPAGGSGRQLGQ